MLVPRGTAEMAGKRSKVFCGDLAALKVEHSATYADGRGTKTQEEILPGLVTSVTRDGMVKAIQDGRGQEHRSQGAFFIGTVVLAADKLAEDVGIILGILESVLDGEPIRDLEELRTLVAPFLRDVSVERWPNQLGWSVAGSNVVENLDDSHTAAVSLPGDRSAVLRFEKGEAPTWTPPGGAPPVLNLRKMVRLALSSC